MASKQPTTREETVTRPETPFPQPPGPEAGALAPPGPERKRRVWPWFLAGMAATLALQALFGVFALVAAVFVGMPLPFDPLFPFGGGGPEPEYAYADIRWGGDGRYVVAQVLEDGVPTVVAWERRTGKLRKASGYRLVAAEPYGARAWMVPERAPQATKDDVFLDLAWDTYDSKPSTLFVWALDDRSSSPTTAAESRWRAWPGGTSIAFPEVDPLKGALPSAIRFQPKGGRGEGVKGEVPAGIRTFLPLGWSPSGRYFACLGLGEIGEDDHFPRGPGGRRFILDSQTGKTVADQGVEGGYETPESAWDAERDVLYYLDIRTDEDEGAGLMTEPEEEYPVMFMDVMGGQGEASARNGWEGLRGPAFGAELLSGGEDPLLQVEREGSSDAWRLRWEGPRRVKAPVPVIFGLPSDLDGDTAAFMDDEGPGLALYVSGPDGKARRIWPKGE